MMAMQAGFQGGPMGAQVNAAWDGTEDTEQDCQLEGDGGWGPSTIPAAAFAAGGPKHKGKGRGKGGVFRPYRVACPLAATDLPGAEAGTSSEAPG